MQHCYQNVVVASPSLTSRRTERREVENNYVGSGQRGLKWVTYEEWRNMPGGQENNPLVEHWKADDGEGYTRKCR